MEGDDDGFADRMRRYLQGEEEEHFKGDLGVEVHYAVFVYEEGFVPLPSTTPAPRNGTQIELDSAVFSGTDIPDLNFDGMSNEEVEEAMRERATNATVVGDVVDDVVDGLADAVARAQEAAEENGEGSDSVTPIFVSTGISERITRNDPPSASNTFQPAGQAVGGGVDEGEEEGDGGLTGGSIAGGVVVFGLAIYVGFAQYKKKKRRAQAARRKKWRERMNGTGSDSIRVLYGEDLPGGIEEPLGTSGSGGGRGTSKQEKKKKQKKSVKATKDDFSQALGGASPFGASNPLQTGMKLRQKRRSSIMKRFQKAAKMAVAMDAFRTGAAGRLAAVAARNRAESEGGASTGSAKSGVSPTAAGVPSSPAASAAGASTGGSAKTSPGGAGDAAARAAKRAAMRAKFQRAANRAQVLGAFKMAGKAGAAGAGGAAGGKPVVGMKGKARVVQKGRAVSTKGQKKKKSIFGSLFGGKSKAAAGRGASNSMMSAMGKSFRLGGSNPLLKVGGGGPQGAKAAKLGRGGGGKVNFSQRNLGLGGGRGNRTPSPKAHIAVSGFAGGEAPSMPAALAQPSGLGSSLFQYAAGMSGGIGAANPSAQLKVTPGAKATLGSQGSAKGRLLTGVAGLGYSNRKILMGPSGTAGRGSGGAARGKGLGPVQSRGAVQVRRRSSKPNARPMPMPAHSPFGHPSGAASPPGSPSRSGAVPPSRSPARAGGEGDEEVDMRGVIRSKWGVDRRREMVRRASQKRDALMGGFIGQGQ